MNSHRLQMTISVMLGAALIFTITLHSPAAAMDTANNSLEREGSITELPSETVGQHANDLLLRISTTIESGQQIDKALENASAEDRLVLNLQRYKLRIQVLNDVSELADALL